MALPNGQWLSSSSLFHAIVQLFMGPAATCPPYSVTHNVNDAFTLLEQQMTSFWQAIWNAQQLLKQASFTRKSH